MTDSALLAELAEALRDLVDRLDNKSEVARQEGRDHVLTFAIGKCIAASNAPAALAKYDARRLEAIRNGVG